MEDKLNHVMFTNMRDVEDSLIFTKLSNFPEDAQEGPMSFNIVIHGNDSVKAMETCGSQIKVDRGDMKYVPKHPMRAMLLKRMASDSTHADTTSVAISTLVMSRIRQADSTGDFEAYQVITWQGKDTVVPALMSRPQFDFLAEKKMALVNPSYKADIFHELLPHMSFALFMWVMVGAAFYYIWKNLRKQIQLNALRDEFVANITHELKTPITTAGVALESLHMAGDIKQPHSQKYLEICQSELKRLSLLVERILHSRSPQVHYEKLDIRQVLDEVMTQMKVQFDKKHADVQVQEEGNGFVINGDKTHMSGVFYNLLDNALKYSKDHPVIRVHLTRNNGSIQLDVEDNGIGIAPDYQDKVFEKLYRVPQQDRHDVKGHGLGLSYVADVVKQHQGKIGLVSEPGKGSTFSMTLPVYSEN